MSRYIFFCSYVNKIQGEINVYNETTSQIVDNFEKMDDEIAVQLEAEQEDYAMGMIEAGDAYMEVMVNEIVSRCEIIIQMLQDLYFEYQ